jgi:serine/threonine protein kinase
LTEIVADQFDTRRPVADRSIGKYMTTDIIGRGGFSIVYKGLHAGLNMPVAIKMLRHNLAMDADFQNTFRNEAHIIASLDHENIIKIYDIEERFRTLFIIEELVTGESLKNMLGRLGKMPIKLTIDFLIQICSGLEYAHQKRIIHRDINPTNIFVTQNDRIKILDFGLACPIGTEDFASLGNVGYMAPEQIKSDILDERTDVYALGITAFEMATGKKPFPVDDIKSLMKMHVECDIPDPTEFTPTMPADLRNFIRKACCRDPNGRHQNVSQAINSLQTLAKEIGLKEYHNSNKKLNMASLFMAYKDEQEFEFKYLMDQIYSKAKELGIVLKSAEFTDI